MFSFYNPKHSAGRPTEGSRLTGTESPGTPTPAPPAASRGSQPPGNLDQGAVSIRQPVSPAKGLWWKHNFCVSFHHPAAAMARLAKINKKLRLNCAFPPHVKPQPRQDNGIASPKSRFTREEHASPERLNHTGGSREEGWASEREGGGRGGGRRGRNVFKQLDKWRFLTPPPRVLT